ncbi:hypothetical protein DERP_006930 [Dermatophagoides pteronyssinus]|uniref:Uncharacterized protein n=1 Tax=Dermatophagoides pteronyssinus TaxID=6956 RepID=A0ABQ8JTP2_DERPT|nr:hypothetical protein DERP_006930 [Dermatophagoides pteronyssinus]
MLQVALQNQMKQSYFSHYLLKIIGTLDLTALKGKTKNKFRSSTIGFLLWIPKKYIIPPLTIDDYTTKKK